jgi:putative PEP-CTERM system TPR-repeat lipoprotein
MKIGNMSSTSGRTSSIALALLVTGAFTLTGCNSRDERATSYYERGAAYLSKKDVVHARIEFRNALQQKGDLVPAWRALAQIEEGERNWKAVGPIWRKIIELDPRDLDTRLRLAKLALLGGALDEALRLADGAVEQNPGDPAAIALKAGILLKLNDATAAAQLAQKALELDPKSYDAITVLAAVRFSKDDIDGALALLNSVPVTTPPDVGLSLFKIKLFEKKQDLAAIETELKGLISGYPQEKSFKSALVQFYIAHQRQGDAEKELREAASKPSSDIDAKLQLVAFLNSIKGPAAGREQLVSMIKAGGDVYRLQVALAEQDYRQGDVDGATTLMRKLISSEPSKDNVVAAKIKLAEMFLGRKDLSSAKPLLADVLKSDKRNVGALRLQAAISIEEGRLEDAVSDLRQALNEQPRSPQLLTLLAAAYERQGSIELADKQLNDATVASSFSPTYSAAYASFLQRRGNLSRAEDILGECATRNPNDPTVLPLLAQIRLMRKNWIGAQEIAEQIRKTGSNLGVSDQIEAGALAGQQKYTEAIGVLRNSYQANPGAAPMLALVRTYMSAKQPERAEAFLQSVLAAGPQNNQARIMLGQVQLASNELSKAEASFKTSIEQNPSDASGYRALSELYSRQNRLDDALKVLRAGIQQNPSNMPLRLGLAGILEIKEDYEGAIATYESMLKDDPTSLVVANNLCSLLSDHRSDAASLDRAYSVASILNRTQVSQFKDTLGWIKHLKGDNKAAVSLLEEAVTELPNVAAVHYHLGMTYRASGEVEKAEEHLKKAAELSAGQNGAMAQKIRAAAKS